MALYDTRTHELIRRFGGGRAEHVGGIGDVAFSPDGRMVISASGDGTMILWDVETGAYLRRFVGHSHEVRGVAFSADGEFIATASADGTIMIWDTASAEAIRRYKWTDTQIVWSIAFSPDGRTVLAGGDNGLISLWRVDATLAHLLGWIDANRVVPDPTDIQCEIYDLTQFCDESGS
jgi:WD40 repeat protein